MRAIAAFILFGFTVMLLGPVVIVSATASRTPAGVSVYVKTDAVFQQRTLIRPDGYVPGMAGEHGALHSDGLWHPPARWRVAKHDLDLRFEIGVMRPEPAPTPSLLARALSYKGTNPTGWARLWCARFMAMIAPELARKIDNPNLARSWARLPKTKAKVGAIVVLTRGRDARAGHIGVVKAFTRRGDLVVVSGNHNRRVGVGVYSKRRVIAYVS